MINYGPVQNPELDAIRMLVASYMALAGHDPEHALIKLENNQITILSTEMKLGDFLSEVLSTPCATREGLKCNLNEVTNNGEVLHPFISPDIDLKTQTAWDVLSHIFSYKLLDICDLDEAKVNTWDSKSEKKLRIPVEDQVGFFELRNAQMKILAAAMERAGLPGMRIAYLCQNKILINNAKAIDEFSNTIRKILNFEKNEDGKCYFVFNYGELVKELFPVQLDVLYTKTDAGIKIVMDRNALVQHLQRTFPEGFIMFCPSGGSLYKMIRLPQHPQEVMGIVPYDVFMPNVKFQIGERMFVILPELNYFEDLEYRDERDVSQIDEQWPNFLPAFGALQLASPPESNAAVTTDLPPTGRFRRCATQ